MIKFNGREYSEMVSTADFRAKMAAAGLEPNSSETEQKDEVPLWLVRSFLLDPDNQEWIVQEIVQSENTTAEIKKRWAENMHIYPKDGTAINFNDDLRFVVCSNGNIIWSNNDDFSTHKELVSYGMLVGEIPRKEKYTFFGWGKDLSSVDDFVCFTNNDKDEVSDRYYVNPEASEIMFSESYIRDTKFRKDIINKMKKNPKYNKALKVLHSSIKAISLYFRETNK